MTTVIVITARRNGFRRCGIGHSDQPITWQPGDFTSEQWRDLVKEPQLIVTCVEVDLEPERELRHALTSSTALPEASGTPQAAEPQAPETVLTPVVAAVVSVADAPLVDDKSGAVAPGTPGIDSTEPDGLVIDGQGPSAGDGGLIDLASGDTTLANDPPAPSDPATPDASSFGNSDPLVNDQGAPAGDGGVPDESSNGQQEAPNKAAKPVRAKPGRTKGAAK